MVENGQALENVKEPHENDVLSGRGNYVNFHPGNEYFRDLVRRHKVAYVAAPKQQKPRFARAIVDEIQRLNPPGRFLKQDAETKLWNDIGDKKSLDKTRQALREGAPDLEKVMKNGDSGPSTAAPAHAASSASYGAMGGSHVAAHFPNHRSAPHAETLMPQSTLLTQQDEAFLMDPVLKTRLEMEALQARLSTLYPLAAPMPQPPAGYTRPVCNGSQHQQQGQQQQQQQQQQRQPSSAAYSPRPDMGKVEKDGDDGDSVISLEQLMAEADAKNIRPWRKSSAGSSRSMGMSMSIGDMTEASNLSAVFEDSMRISEDSLVKASSPKQAAKPVDKAPAMNSSLMNFDMSVVTLGDLPEGFEGSSMNMSFTHVFEESDPKFTVGETSQATLTEKK